MFQFDIYGYNNIIMTQNSEALKGQSPTKKIKIQNSLQSLKKASKVVADSGDFHEIQKYHPEDSTTNPSLLLQVASKSQFAYLIDQSIKYGLQHFYKYFGKEQNPKQKKGKKGKKQKQRVTDTKAQYSNLSITQKADLEKLICDHLSVSFGAEILKKIPGYISTQVDASLSFDTQGTVSRAKRIIALYKQIGVPKQRVLIKIASTWQGIKAAEQLKKEKVNCNMTLIFNKTQAIQCALSGLFLISPFVGRILDWFKKNYPKQYVGKEDPGVKSVTQIYNYFKKYNHQTIIMGASFRNISQILQLAGCDRLTISPSLLKELEASTLQATVKLSAQQAKKLDIQEIEIDQKSFRYDLNNDAMATQKLAEGIRKFDQDTKKLRQIIRSKLIV